MPQVSIIAAVAQNRVIGQNGRLPWELPEDMYWFKTQTMHKPVIMGRKTFEAIGRPLPRRLNIVISRKGEEEKENLLWTASVEEALEKARQAPDYANVEIMILGGGEIYSQTLALADRLYLTEIDASPDGDAWFPSFDKRLWERKILEEYPSQNGQPAFVITQYDRV